MPFEDRAYNRESNYGSGPRFIFPMPSKLTFALLIACTSVFFIQAFARQSSLWLMLTFEDALAFKQPWRWITYQYAHAGGMHLFWNLLSIYFLVPALEARWGWKRTFTFYTAGGVVAGIAFGFLSLFFGHLVPLVGASGCVFAVLGALAAIAPDMQILAMMIIPITMRTIALLYTILFIFTIVGDHDLSAAAHLGGMAFGFFMPYALGPAWRKWQQSGTRQVRTRNVKAERDEQELIDRILQKVHDSGMNSLNWSERRAAKEGNRTTT